VHTARWIVDKCLGGDLVKGRTVLLVSHNILLVEPLSDFVVSVGLDGHVRGRKSISEALKQDSLLLADIDKEKEQLATKPEETDKKEMELPSGKLFETEKVAKGRVSRESCKCFRSYVWPVTNAQLK
jgi:hypothetical protein